MAKGGRKAKDSKKLTKGTECFMKFNSKGSPYRVCKSQKELNLKDEISLIKKELQKLKINPNYKDNLDLDGTLGVCIGSNTMFNWKKGMTIIPNTKCEIAWRIE